ncbi:hypothetical protein B0J15DRAFT_492521 [Fusarium solani]|uniref:Uncharacterized protein n=1 Tax=Fusarium solani TaxID=169388 RepID=A0A9P9KG97_FUSSL|nr:uncharacterized protein B0J15DRAFT_492521 [Fusarium solani]KAH7260443.1 hypothetical protein B0J15DRAFT_492521 [Fusarium solani]
MGNQSSTPSDETPKDAPTAEQPQKKSLYQRYQDQKRGPGLSDEDIKKYTGMNRDELNTWAETQPGVGKNQLAGRAAGPASGLGGVAAADGLGGWGPSTEPNDGKRGMKFPPEKPKTREIDEDESD